MDKVNFTSPTPPNMPRLEPLAVASQPIEDLKQSKGTVTAADGVLAKENAYLAVEKFTTLVQELQRKLDFSVDDASGQVVVKVTDGESGKLVRQIPSEELLRLSERLEDMRSLLFKAEA